MKITINQKLPTKLILGKEPTDFKDVKRVVEIPDDLVNNAIAVIDELFDRASELRTIEGTNKLDKIDTEDRFIDVVFPVFPGVFSQVDKIHKDSTKEIVKNVRWNNYWAEFPYKDIPVKRISILKILGETDFVFTGDIPNIEFSEHIEDKVFVIDVHKDKLINLRKKLVAYQEKIEERMSVANPVFQCKNYDGVLYVTLNFDGSKDIKFQKISAAILKFFKEASEASKGYKIYKDFNEFFAENQSIKNITSNTFSKRIDSINKRVKKETEGIIKELIEKKSTGKNQINSFRWNENV